VNVIASTPYKGIPEAALHEIAKLFLGDGQFIRPADPNRPISEAGYFD
jgi:hypothetical protein